MGMWSLILLETRLEIIIGLILYGTVLIFPICEIWDFTVKVFNHSTSRENIKVLFPFRSKDTGVYMKLLSTSLQQDISKCLHYDMYGWKPGSLDPGI